MNYELMDLIDAYADARCTHGHPSYNAKAGEAREKIRAALAAAPAQPDPQVEQLRREIAGLRELLYNRPAQNPDLVLEYAHWTKRVYDSMGAMVKPAANAALAGTAPVSLDSDLAKLTERGAKAWAGVDAQKLREGEAP